MLSLRVGITWTTDGPTGGSWLHGLTPFGDLSYATSLYRCTDQSGGGGLLTVGWSMLRNLAVSLPSLLRQGQVIGLYVGPGRPLGFATIAETPRGSDVVADGVFRRGEKFYAVDGSGLPTTDLSVALPLAVAAGLEWRYIAGTFPSGSLSSYSEASVNYNTITAVLNAYCKLNNKIWWIDRHSFLRLGDLPTTPRYSLTPDVPSMESADDDFASTVFVRRVDGVDADGQPNMWDGASASDPDAPFVVQTSFDLEQLGYRSAPDAVDIAEAILDSNKARSGYSEGLSLQRGQLHRGGVNPEPWQVLAHDPMVLRSTNWVNSSGNVQIGRAKDWVLGGTAWRQGEPLTVTPMGLAPRTQAQIVQSTTERPELVFR